MTATARTRSAARALKTKVGDKVRVKEGSGAGLRGVVFLVGDSQLAVNLADGRQISARPEALTNFSLAARRAWAVMPKRAGRPAASIARTRMISVRIDARLLEETERGVEMGRFKNRTAAIEAGLKVVLRSIDQRSKQRMSATTPKHSNLMSHG